MNHETSKLVETNAELTCEQRKLTLDDLEAVSGGAFDACLRLSNGIHFLNPQPLPPG